MSFSESKPWSSDHRKIGCDQELFFFHPLSPGSAFWYPKGAHIYNKLVHFFRKEYRRRGFSEVITPNIYNCKLWQISGHWDHYCDNIFAIDDELFGLKPMNCPGHCLMYSHEPRTYKDLPLRYADFGVLHSRNEMSGSMSGLTRVRRFQQDDAHIFCRRDQIGEEITACLDFLSFCYEKVFRFTFKLNLSTRPVHFMGEVETWDEAEEILKKALNESGKEWELRKGDGAFYGPKIDITIEDALKRNHQCATIQLDFQLPQRFDLSYHRYLPNLEAILAKVIAVQESVKSYAVEVKHELHAHGFEAEVDERCSDTFNRQIRKAIEAQFNFILVVGENEMKNGTVNVRSRNNRRFGEVHLDKLISAFRQFDSEYSKDDENFTLNV
ncbi:unnamed protein product [Strongylus vulgaris]|uniref:threonine--tRNA ligase n=1 Tax=Strongylus vulgaris TaxID=40348 RepID=A0A3P7KBM4_STRVU|nr:unnamed protein product [Strongylus vulgaris]